METKTVLYIIFAAIAALLVTVFQYVYKSKRKSNINLVLAFLRFLGVFGILLLIINPQFSKIDYQLIKPNLIILVDNSTSVSSFQGDVNSVISSIIEDNDISDKFKVTSYSFGKNIKTLDSLNFNEKNTNIQKALYTIEEVYSREESAIVLLSDGNQTVGLDYSFAKPNDKVKVFPVILGDTTKFKDVAIGPIIVNNYAFLKNKFPLETYITYQGVNSETVSVEINMNGLMVAKETVNFDSENNYKLITTEIEANAIGQKNITVSASVLSDEVNTNNNLRTATIEVIDEKTNIALVSEIVHPDLGAIKKAIESNEQRKVFILKPDVTLAELEEIDVFIFYQPTRRFSNSIKYANKKRTGTFYITGKNTDYNFLNSAQDAFQIESGYPIQEVFGIKNQGFSKYDISDFEIADFPPLESNAGPLTFNIQNETVFSTQIKGLDIQKPLWSVYENNSTKLALLLGENIWKWRMQAYRNKGEFKNFDDFIGNLVRYLSNNKNKSRLNVEYEKQFEGSSNAVITATYFDEAFLFDPNAKVFIKIDHKAMGTTTKNPMVLKNGYFEIDLSNLIPGDYDFTVTVDKESISKSGSFAISEFDLEKQFVSSDFEKMQQLALNSGGTIYFPSQQDSIKQALLGNNAFVPTEKSIENIVSLIDFKFLLGLIIFVFALEWFIRKYNGLI